MTTEGMVEIYYRYEGEHRHLGESRVDVTIRLRWVM